MMQNRKSILACERLYAITDCTNNNQQQIISTTRSLFEAGVNLLQYRNKTLNNDNKLLAIKLRNLCRQYDAIFIVNDDVNLAYEIDADGVHLGQDDTKIENARVKLPQKIIGISCYNDFDRAISAEQHDADYVAFGSFFPSTTKPHAQQASTTLLQRAASELKVPVVAIGGITPENAKQLIDAGADYLAVISALYECTDPYKQAQNYLSLFKE